MSHGIAAVLLAGFPGHLDLMRVGMTAAPELLSSLTIQGHRLGQSENRLCVVNYWDHSIAVFDIANPAEPVQTAVYRDETLSQISGSAGTLSLTDTLMAYATESSGIVLVDLFDPANPTRIGALQGTARALQFHADTLYVLRDQELVLFDVRAPAQPRQLGSIHIGENNRGFDVHGDRICAYGQTTLQIIDVSDTALPRDLGRMQPGFTIHHFQIENAMIYAAGQTGNFSRMAVFDAADPAAIRQVGERITAAPHQLFCVRDGKVYIASPETGFQILDLSTPQDLTTIQPYATPSMMVDIDYADQRLYVVYDSGLDGSWVEGFNIFTLSGSTRRQSLCDRG